MNVFAWLLFFCGVLITTQFRTHPRILGGYACDYVNEMPYAVGLFSEDSGFVRVCVGSLITMQWVLTAAHCIHPEIVLKNGTYVRTGFNYDNVTSQKRYAIKGIHHDSFNRSISTLFYDIGLLLVEKSFDNIDGVRPGRLPPSLGFTSNCTEGTAVGTGVTEIHPNYTAKSSTALGVDATLACVDLPIVSSEWCEELAGPRVVCTMSDEGKGFCSGDSGGPLVCKGVIIGIISSHRGCAKPGSPQYHSAVESYLDFIDTHVKGLVRSLDLVTNERSTKGHSDKNEIISILLIIGILTILWM